MVAERVRVENLAQVRRSLRAAGDMEELGLLRDGLKAAADIVAQEARRRVPRVSGRAQDSIRATAGGNTAYVVGGKARVPYYGWLDFGDRSPIAGRPRSVGPWADTGSGPKRGRFIYPAFDAKERQVIEVVDAAVGRALRKVGL